MGLSPLSRSCLIALLVAGAALLRAGPMQDDSSAEPATAELAADSSFWPFRVNLNEEVRAQGGQAGVSGLSPGILIRVEGGLALVDFGREGLHRFPLEATDFREGALAVRRGEGDKDLPNFLRYTANSFARVTADGKRENIPVDEMEDLRHLLIAYVDQRLFDEPAAVEAFRQMSADLKAQEVWTLTFPTDLGFFIPFRDSDLPLVFCLPHLCGPMVEVLSHNPGDRAKFVFIDAEGLVLEEWEADYADLPELAPAIIAAVAAETGGDD
jgi:hypothetical protein